MAMPSKAVEVGQWRFGEFAPSAQRLSPTVAVGTGGLRVHLNQACGF